MAEHGNFNFAKAIGQSDWKASGMSIEAARKKSNLSSKDKLMRSLIATGLVGYLVGSAVTLLSGNPELAIVFLLSAGLLGSVGKLSTTNRKVHAA